MLEPRLARVVFPGLSHVANRVRHVGCNSLHAHDPRHCNRTNGPRSESTERRSHSKAAFFVSTHRTGEAPMTKLRAAAAKFVRDEEGASLAEYGLLLALIAVVCIGGMTVLGTKINSMFSSLSSSI